MQRSPLYTILFATVVCIACAIVVSSSAVSLKERQEINAALEKQRNVLQAAGLMANKEKLSSEEIQTRFATIRPVVVDLVSGKELPDVDAALFDQKVEAKEPSTSKEAPDNLAKVRRLPDRALVYKLFDDQEALDLIVLPIEGKGLWSTLYGFLALDADLATVRGITFYEHGETPGLGGEVDNAGWKAKWIGRRAFGDDGEIEIEVIKGRAGPPTEDPHAVDGLSGATLTARGVSHLVRFWLGENGFGPYLQELEKGRAA